MKYWETIDGTQIAYNKLTDSHLLNILKWIKKKAKTGVEDGCAFYDGNDDFMTGDIWTTYGKEVLDMFDYKGLKKEAKKRNLMVKLVK